MNDLPENRSDTDRLLERLSGTPVGPERLVEVVAAYQPILEEISRLRHLDLTDVHPAVIFEPTAPYRRGGR